MCNGKESLSIQHRIMDGHEQTLLVTCLVEISFLKHLSHCSCNYTNRATANLLMGSVCVCCVVCACMCMCGCVNVCVCVCATCICAHTMHIHACVRLYIYSVCVCSWWLHVYACRCVCVYMCMHIYICMHGQCVPGLLVFHEW